MLIHDHASHLNRCAPLHRIALRAFDSGPLLQSYEHACAYIAALVQGDPNIAVIDARAIHDTRKDIAAIPRRGTLPQLWQELCALNSKGYGVFITINEMDGLGREIANVKTIRCQAVDLDSLSAQQNYERATQFNPAPSFAVQSSPGKLHVYWQTQKHDDRDRFAVLQRKLRTVFDGDKRVVDPSRVLRLPGTIHAKNPNMPHLVKCWALSNYNKPIDPGSLEAALYSVNVIDGTGDRYELGEPKMQAPGWDWCLRALAETNPNDLDRDAWVGFTAAWKQAAWNFAPEQQLYSVWAQWCSQYIVEGQGAPSDAYLRKNWTSLRSTELGWPSLERRNGNLHALRLFGEKRAEEQRKSDPLPMPHEHQQSSAPQSMPIPTGELLTDREQREWFKGCVLIGPENTIFGPRGIRYDVGSFNSTYGGKNFVVDGLGKTVNKAWEAATNSRLWRIPTVDGTCFRPRQVTGEIISDGLSRTYINTYIPATIECMDGDAMPFLRHIALVLPDAHDQRILIDFLAHNARFPGHKIPWSPLIQSTEGIGKNVFKQVMRHVIDTQYFYQPKAKQLNDSGSKFNGWMEGKLFFLVDEIKTDEKRDMVETLKPFITETELEIEAKTVNQKMGDTPGNWLFFSNHKDAIPIHANGRRFAIFYSPLQTVDDLKSRGMNDDYFNGLYGWLGNEQNGGHKTGLKIVANYLLNYPIECGAVPMRAPKTTSTAEALIESRGWLEQLIAEAVDDGLQGFRAGWISTAAVARLLRERGNKPVAARTLGKAIGNLQYHHRGQAGRAYFADDPSKRGVLWSVDENADVANYGRAQGYE
ncbi:DUF5906 domain-containing protein [Bradyrhizobium japonicum]|uniref:DUF5906 domain-containing protein n=1 Tax=Bradyrhizobium japonicum TaxID=375 RepID=UPI001E4B6DB8|nr:DUF5906 domain-containing protein [Bradyrhizobium japonicum]MCD9825330.1 RepB family DNA primase [Bradyrhizobium japonicum]MCD9898307.1 RepB family DNA primase [Bradyrhizobium japonicum]MCP1766093.1 hypothetical protein [Bradyrhizobium japonicum]MCP1788231.1 hypothetical protein [Bradyrhizobium japonicum]MCP1810106.1 hypothetical protein [Bradyrhizobium japonicum]